ESSLKAALGPLLREVVLFDRYVGPGLEPGSKSLAMGLILQDVSRTLTDRDADQAVAGALEALARDCGARLRARFALDTAVYRGGYGTDQGRNGRASVRRGRFEQARGQGIRGLLLRCVEGGAGAWAAGQAVGLRQFRPAPQEPAAGAQPQDRRGDSDLRPHGGDLPSRPEAEGAGGSLCWIQAVTANSRRSRPSATSPSVKSASCATSSRTCCATGRRNSPASSRSSGAATGATTSAMTC